MSTRLLMWGVVLMVAVLTVLTGLLSSAEAVLTIRSAAVVNGVAVVEGGNAPRAAPISWESAQVTQANNGGNFAFQGVVPADCVGRLEDGVPADAVNVALANCSPVSEPPGDSVGVRLPMVCNTSVEQPLSPYFVAGFAEVNGAGDLQVNLTGVQPGAYYCQGKCYGAVVSEFPGLVSEPACGVASDNGHLVIDVPGFFAPLMQQALNNDHVAVYACFGLSLRLGSVVQARLDVGCASGPVDTSICAPAGGACPCGACP